MSIENADTSGESTRHNQFENELVTVLRELGEDVEPWKLRPPESADEPAKLLLGARIGLVRGRLEGVDYEIHDLKLPVEDDGWVAAWEIHPES